MDITTSLIKFNEAIQLDGAKIITDLTQIANDYEKGNSLLTSDQYTSICVILDCLRQKQSPE
jgi:hypothetical protein